jgi:hypothetical protein
MHQCALSIVCQWRPQARCIPVRQRPLLQQDSRAERWPQTARLHRRLPAMVRSELVLVLVSEPACVRAPLHWSNNILTFPVESAPEYQDTTENATHVPWQTDAVSSIEGSRHKELELRWLSGSRLLVAPPVMSFVPVVRCVTRKHQAYAMLDVQYHTGSVGIEAARLKRACVLYSISKNYS